MHDLSDLGFGPFFTQQLSSSDRLAARIAAEHRTLYEVWCERGAGTAQLSGRLRSELADDRLPCTGDWVILQSEPLSGQPTVIERVLERRTAFTRVAAGRETRVQAAAANVDLVFAVCGLDGDFNIHRIERTVARIWASGAEPAVVLNKTDVGENVASHAAEAARRCPGVPVFRTSALMGEGIEPLRRCIRKGETAAFVGSSGAGKSSLINALLGEDRLATGAVRAHDSRGRHVTTHRQLVMLPTGGLVLDTPGMRELQLVDEEGLDAVFEDIAALSARCRFADCRHDNEPGCAVKQAVETGALAPDRLEHFRKLAHEAQSSERRLDARLRRQDARVWGKLTREAARLRRFKGHSD